MRKAALPKASAAPARLAHYFPSGNEKKKPKTANLL